MDVGWQYNLIALFILFIFSAFFSGSEVALFSLDRKRLKSKTASPGLADRYLYSLLEHPRRLLVSILIGNTIVNVAASIAAVMLALKIAETYSISEDIALTIQIIVLTILVILFGELIPKVWASKNPLSFARAVAIPLYWINVFLFPIAETLTEIIRILVSKFRYDRTKTVILPEEIHDLADLGHERGTIIEEEHGLIQSIVMFKSVMAHEVMTPRVDMVSLSVSDNFDNVMNVITSSGHSRIPLYNEDLDEIIGILYAKDLLPYLRDKQLQKQLSLAKIARKALFIPRIKLINDLLHELQEKKTHIAIVVDEYGGTAGLITLEDIIEEIIGEIRDEYDKEESPVQKIDNNTYMVLGKLTIDDLNELLSMDVDIENGDFETVGGLVLNQAGHIPKEGYSFLLNQYKFTVKEIINKRIKKILIEKIQAE